VRVPTEQPRVLLVFSIISLLVAAAVGAISYADQHRRINDPVGYAERQCGAQLPGVDKTTSVFKDCVTKEQAKSTISSILPFFVLGIIVTVFGVIGIVIGRVEVRRQKERQRRLTKRFGDPQDQD
jgi:hypothetical protein